MPVAYASKTTKNAVADGPVTTSSFTPTAGVVHVLWIVSEQAAATCPIPNSLSSSAGDTFTQINTELWVTSKRRITAWWFLPATSAARTITFGWASVQASYAAGVVECQGADPATPVVNSDVDFATTGAAALVTLTPPPSAPSATLGIFASAATGSGVTVGSGFAVIHQSANANMRAVAEGRVDDDATVDFTFAASNHWAGIAIELAPIGGTSVLWDISTVFAIDPASLPSTEPPPVEPPPVDDGSGGDGAVQSAYARPRIARSPDSVELLASLQQKISDLGGLLTARYGSTPIYDGADPANPPDSSEWIRADTLERCTRVNGVTYRKPL